MNLRGIPFWLTATAVLVTAFVVVGVWYSYRISNRILWSMINVGGAQSGAGAHLIELPSGHRVLIDTSFDDAARRILIPYLDERGIDHVNQVFITRAHRGRYGGVAPLLDRSGYVGSVYFNLPSESGCGAGASNAGCDYARVARTRDLIKSSGASLRALSTDELLYHDAERDIILEVVYAADGDEPPGRGGTLLRLVYGQTTVLFTGDVNDRTSSRLVDEHFFLDSTLLSTPLGEHGSGASDRFLDRVDPKAILISDSAGRWRGPRGERMRQFAFDKGIDTYVTGLHGNVVVAVTADGFTVSTQKTPPGQQPGNDG